MRELLLTGLSVALASWREGFSGLVDVPVDVYLDLLLILLGLLVLALAGFAPLGEELSSATSARLGVEGGLESLEGT